MRKLALLLGMTIAMAAGQAMAQTYRHELSFFGNWTRLKQSGQAVSVSILDVDYGYYFTPQMVGTLGISRFSTDGMGSTDVMLGGKYYFGVGRRDSILPYLAGGLGTTKTAVERARRWELGGGFAYFLTESTSFDVGIDWFGIKTNPSTSGTIIGMGFTTRF
jgi:hypothetical protein